MVNFRWNIFDGGINAATAQSQMAQSRNSLATKALNQNQAVKEVRSSYGKMKTAKVGIDSARLALQSAELAQVAARTRFEVGVGDITDVVQATTAVSSASQDYSGQILKYNNAVVELYRYSATWPESVQAEVDARINSLRANPQP